MISSVLKSYWHFQDEIGYLLYVLATGNTYVFRVWMFTFLCSLTAFFLFL